MSAWHAEHRRACACAAEIKHDMETWEPPVKDGVDRKRSGRGKAMSSTAALTGVALSRTPPEKLPDIQQYDAGSPCGRTTDASAGEAGGTPHAVSSSPTQVEPCSRDSSSSWAGQAGNEWDPSTTGSTWANSCEWSEENASWTAWSEHGASQQWWDSGAAADGETPEATESWPPDDSEVSLATGGTTATAAKNGADPDDMTGYKFEDFEAFGGSIGRGASGSVKKVVNKHTGQIFAMKVISKHETVEQQMVEYLACEVRTQLKLKHPNILRLYHFFDTTDNVHMLLEYAPGGSLFQMLRRHGKIDEEEAKSIFVEMARALDYAHQQGVVHRDVKPENILMCEDGTSKLADFGWCAELDGKNRKTFCGTWDYLSPEMVESEDYDHSVDVWAVGVLLYEMLVGRPPFSNASEKGCLTRIMRVDLQMPDELPELARDLISKLLVKKPEDRLPLKEALQHPWAKNHQRKPRESSAPKAASFSAAAAAAAALGMLKGDRHESAACAPDKESVPAPVADVEPNAKQAGREHSECHVPGVTGLQVNGAAHVLSETVSFRDQATASANALLSRPAATPEADTSATRRWDTPSTDDARCKAWTPSPDVAALSARSGTAELPAAAKDQALPPTLPIARKVSKEVIPISSHDANAVCGADAAPAVTASTAVAAQSWPLGCLRKGGTDTADAKKAVDIDDGPEDLAAGRRSQEAAVEALLTAKRLLQDLNSPRKTPSTRSERSARSETTSLASNSGKVGVAAVPKLDLKKAGSGTPSPLRRQQQCPAATPFLSPATTSFCTPSVGTERSAVSAFTQSDATSMTSSDAGAAHCTNWADNDMYQKIRSWVRTGPAVRHTLADDLDNAVASLEATGLRTRAKTAPDPREVSNMTQGGRTREALGLYNSAGPGGDGGGVSVIDSCTESSRESNASASVGTLAKSTINWPETAKPIRTSFSKKPEEMADIARISSTSTHPRDLNCDREISPISTKIRDRSTRVQESKCRIPTGIKNSGGDISPDGIIPSLSREVSPSQLADLPKKTGSSVRFEKLAKLEGDDMDEIAPLSRRDGRAVTVTPFLQQFANGSNTIVLSEESSPRKGVDDLRPMPLNEIRRLSNDLADVRKRISEDLDSSVRTLRRDSQDSVSTVRSLRRDSQDSVSTVRSLRRTSYDSVGKESASRSISPMVNGRRWGSLTSNEGVTEDIIREKLAGYSDCEVLGNHGTKDAVVGLCDLDESAFLRPLRG